MKSTHRPNKASTPVILRPSPPQPSRVSRSRKGVPVHVCELCRPAKTFTRAEHLRRHQLSHKPAVCSCRIPGCDKSFHRQDLLDRHIENHRQKESSTNTSSIGLNGVKSIFRLLSPNIENVPATSGVDKPSDYQDRVQYSKTSADASHRRLDTSRLLFTQDKHEILDVPEYPEPVGLHSFPKASTSSSQWLSSGSQSPYLPDVYRQDNYKLAPANLGRNQVLQGSQMASGVEKLTNDRFDIATDSGYASLGSGQRRSQLRNEIRSTLHKSSSATANFTEDNNTEYSDARSLRETKIEIYISEFAEELAAVLPQSISAEQLSSLSAALPDLLKAFAVRFGQEENTCAQFRLLYLVHRYRNQISKAVVDTFAIEEQETEEELQKPSNVMPIQDKMDLWNRKNDQLIEDLDSVVAQTHNENIGHGEFDQFPGYDDEDFLEGFPEIQEYRQTLLNSPAYSWLLKSVIIEVELEIPEGFDDARGKIRRKILEFLGEPSRISQKDAPAPQRIVFQLPWIRDFLISQEYDIPIHRALPRALVVVGVDDQSFVTTCSDYLETLWPDIGPQILGLCISLLNSPCGFIASCTLFDKTEISAKIDFKGSTVEFFVIGNVYSLAEIGQLVVWLSAAFNNGCSGHNLVYRNPTCNICSPFLDPLSVNQKPHLVRSAPYLNFHFAESPSQSTPNADLQGRCWVDLFGNRPVVGGYPIPRRQAKRTGVEIPLDLMLQLVNASRISKFSGSILIKGCSAVLVPTQYSQDIIFWHLVFDHRGGYISYTDPRVKKLLINGCAKGLTRGSLETARHVVGWCSYALNHAGTADANYSIGWSSLKTPGPGFAFDKISITGGMFVNAGVSAMVGKKDKPVHVMHRKDYTMRLKWVSKKFVVLYDVQERRAWLLDGASALLHLVRASLKHDLNDPFKSLLLYQESALVESPVHHSGKNAAINVLTNPKNLDIPLYAKPDTNRVEVTTREGGRESKVNNSTKTNYCLKDKIEDICSTLEQILANQAETCTEDGVGFKVKASDRRHIEGFDFMDIATDEDPCWPRQMTLRSSGRGWVDFVRAIHAVTLFGNGFGDLISPSKPRTNECTSCHANTDLPKGQDLLAVCVSELQDIIQKRGSKDTTPWRLVDDIYWLTPDKTFEPCQPGQGLSAKCDRVQVLLPATFPKLWGRKFKSPGDLTKAPRGALIFGHSRRFPLRWGDRGAPEQGDADQDYELDNLQTAMQDSGIGTSLDSSSSNGVNSPPSMSSTPPVQERVRAPIHALERETESEPAPKRRRINDLFSNMRR